MKMMKKTLILLASLALLVAMFGGCGQQQVAETTAPPVANTGANVSHTVTVKTVGGMTMENIAVSVFGDEAMTDLKGYGQTNASGVATVELPQSGTYYIAISGCPKGYNVQKYYSFSGTSASIVLTPSLVKGESLGDTTLGLGDVMYDFTVNTPDGESVTLSKLLGTKKMVLLNFWYTTCSWCVTEFPYMEEAYQQYQEDVAIVALNPTGESDADIKAFPINNGLSLSFPLANCPAAWANTFGISGYPTSVIVDRYGVIVMVEPGAITSLRPFSCLFETLTADDYEQKLYSTIGDVVTQVKPTFEMADSETVAGIMGTTGLDITFRPEDGDEAEYSWPFIETEKNGEVCLKASNQGYDDSYAILYADVTLKAGEALGFDYLRSSETAADTLHIIVNEEAVYSISGYYEEEKWETCYPVVAEKDGTYEVAICYIKDESTGIADDTFYIKNMRIVTPDQIDAPTYLPRPAAVPAEDGRSYTYVDVVYNENDGYYHVGSANGPLLLADLMNYTQFSQESTIWEMAYNGEIKLDGVDYVEKLTTYCNYASNSQLNGICTVNQELYELLQIVDTVQGFSDSDDKEWLKICKYFAAYGTKGEQLEDPIKGLATFSAYKATLGKNVASNFFYYNRIIMPRGLYAEFVPTRSGVYRITSRTDSGNRVDGWIFSEDKTELMVYEWDERMFTDGNNVSMVFYMEKGKSYYIDIAFWDLYEVGNVYYDIEFLGSSYAFFRNCSPGPFTYDTDATGSAMYHTIAKGIDVVLGDDGIYYHDLGNGKKGSPIYVDFTGYTMLGRPFLNDGDVKGVIELGGFDFSKTEDDLYVLSFLKQNDNDPEKTIEYLKGYWGESYEEYFEIYQVNEVLDGIYHGSGEDMTDEIKKYMDDIITSGSSERRGCVVVTEELAEILQMLMDKYTFKGVDTSWRKLCYYYDYMG